ncbi:unnamed protein product [Amoebophrya sp. A25]|nr:unnamed protein product [Amoebophrya sp. A25]|eukprot:GSA25T00008723001.1
MTATSTTTLMTLAGYQRRSFMQLSARRSAGYFCRKKLANLHAKSQQRRRDQSASKGGRDHQRQGQDGDAHGSSPRPPEQAPSAISARRAELSELLQSKFDGAKDKKTLQKAYYKKAKACHPDRNPKKAHAFVELKAQYAEALKLFEEVEKMKKEAGGGGKKGVDGNDSGMAKGGQSGWDNQAAMDIEAAAALQAAYDKEARAEMRNTVLSLGCCIAFLCYFWARVSDSREDLTIGVDARDTKKRDPRQFIAEKQQAEMLFIRRAYKEWQRERNKIKKGLEGSSETDEFRESRRPRKIPASPRLVDENEVEVTSLSDVSGADFCSMINKIAKTQKKEEVIEPEPQKEEVYIPKYSFHNNFGMNLLEEDGGALLRDPVVLGARMRREAVSRGG